MKTKKNIAVETTPAIDNAKAAIENENTIVETKQIEPQVFKAVGFVQLPANKKQAVVGLKVHKNKGLMKAAQVLAEKKVAKELETKAFEEKHQKAVENVTAAFGRIKGYIKEAELKKLFYKKPLANEATKALGQIRLYAEEFGHSSAIMKTYGEAYDAVAAAFGKLDEQIQAVKDKDKNLPLKGAFDGLKIQ